MKKYISLILTAILVFNLCPVSFGGAFSFTTNANASETDKPVLIYMAEDFETQVIGEMPYGFNTYGLSSEPICFGDVVERNGNASNKAAVFQSTSTSSRPVRVIPFYYAPLEHEYVVDFKFNIGNNAEILIQVSSDATSISAYSPEFSRKNIITITDSVKVFTASNTSTTVKTGISRNAWHRFQMKHNFNTDTVDIYIDGTLAQSNVPIYAMNNIASYRIHTPALNGTTKTKFYLDDINVYLSNKIISDTELAAALSGFKNSGLAPDPRYQMGFLSHYGNYMYDMFYNEFVMSGMSSRRVYRNNRFYDLPISTYIENDITYVPIRAFAEMMGATVGYNNGVVSISYNGKTMEVEEGKNVYYVNGKPATLRYPIQMVEGHSTMNLDILCNFLGIEYVRYENLTALSSESYDIISFSGELDTEYSLLGTDAKTVRGRTLKYELISRMMELLQNEIPSPETLLEVFEEKNPTSAHPRILITDFEEIKDGLNRGDSLYNSFVNNFISQADSQLNETSINSNSVNGESAYRTLIKVAFAWNMTGEQKYLDFINNKIDLLYEYATVTYDTLSAKPNALSQGNACIGFGILYDWMYNYLSVNDTARLEKLRTVVKTMGIDWFDTQFRTPTVNSMSALAYSYGNQPILINMGAISACLALIDEYPVEASRVLAQAIKNSVPSFRDFAPAGGWAEGMAYWQYTVDTMPLVINALDSALGTDFGLYSMQGVNKTTEYPMSTKGSSSKTFLTGDGADMHAYHHSVFMFEAKKNNDVSKAIIRRNNTSNRTITDIVNWVFLENDDVDVEYKTDYYMPKIENVLLKTDNTSNATAVLLHGGGVNDGHGHEDNGTFMFDMIGYRWAADLGREDYNICQFGDYVGRDSQDPDKPYTGYTSFDYYRNNAEGHNTVIANLGATRLAMNSKAKSNIIGFDASDTMSYGIVDMTQTNSIFECAERGIKLDKINNEILVHDSFKASEPTDFYWLMHTEADIEVAADGRSAILSNGTKRIWMGIVSNDNYIIENMAPEHLGNFPKAAELYPGEVMRPEGYENSIIRPPLESPVDKPFTAKGFATAIAKGFRRLTIRTTQDTDKFDIMVAFKPLASGESAPSVLPSASRMETWSTTTGKAALLDMITVYDAELHDFEPNKFNYTIKSLSVPEIKATANEKYDIEVIPATAIPGTTSIIVKEDEKLKNIYYVNIYPAD